MLWQLIFIHQRYHCNVSFDININPIIVYRLIVHIDRIFVVLNLLFSPTDFWNIKVLGQAVQVSIELLYPLFVGHWCFLFNPLCLLQTKLYGLPGCRLVKQFKIPGFLPVFSWFFLDQFFFSPTNMSFIVFFKPTHRNGSFNIM